MSDPKLHAFAHDVTEIALPEQFNNPFHYTPHPLCLIAAKELQDKLIEMREYRALLLEGKMFGVLVVANALNEFGYLAAFSGNLGGSNELPFFVPPVFDLLHEEGYFRREESEITALNREIEALECDSHFLALNVEYEREYAKSTEEIQQAKELQRQSKIARDNERANYPTNERLAELQKESQFEKANIKRLERKWREQLSELERQRSLFEDTIAQKKLERKMRSADLQQWLFEQFELLNAAGEHRNLIELFSPTTQKTPPAGAGECAAPKLLQYAYLKGLKPIAMAEFWLGDSPNGEVRRSGQFYPACKGKCEPILKHMLQGLSIDSISFAMEESQHLPLPIVYEDDYLLIVNKPSGLLSVPGKLSADSVWHRISKLHPEYDGPLVVHRLDMATSGLLIIAKSKSIHKQLQQLFKSRKIKKRYVALLEGDLPLSGGIIDLPLCLDPQDRPRQMVNEEFGKRAITRWAVLERKERHILVAFYPETGRTHQLRVHAAHHLGLNAPIVGDELYGKKAERLYLHAERLEFIHPATNEMVIVEAKADF